MSVARIAEEYFSQLNSMARRMYVDMNETKLAYDNLWNSFSDKEQKEILSDSIITPEILVRYKSTEINDNKIKEYAAKLIIDDNCSYQDEHSGPFSFQTRSQRDLTLFGNNNSERTVNKPKTKSKVTPKIQDITQTFTNDLSSFGCKESTGGNTLPKTGLDFLDNW